MAEPIDIMAAIRQIASERKIDADEIINAIKDAIKTGYRREYNLVEEDPLEVEFDPINGSIVVYVKKTVVDKVEDANTEISTKEAAEMDDSIKEGDDVLVDVTAEGDFGRIAAQTARQVILQKLRESEKTAAIEEVKDSIGTIDSVLIQKITREGDVICELNRARAVMPASERVPTEFYQLGSRVKVLLKSLEEDSRGQFVLISRADDEFLKELFRMEVPEIDSETVEIVSIARDPGSRSKVAVKSNSEGIDPIGSCVGQKGVRINAIMNELKLGKFEEKVDIILWDEDIENFILNAIRPAEGLKVELDQKTKTATIEVHPDQHSLAVGREGQNAELASKLTGWNITIESDESLATPDEREEDNESNAEEAEVEIAEGEEDNVEPESDDVEKESSEEVKSKE